MKLEYLGGEGYSHRWKCKIDVSDYFFETRFFETMSTYDFDYDVVRKIAKSLFESDRYEMG